VDVAGRVTGISTIARDITESKRAKEAREELDERLVQSRRLESLGQLAGGIAHDFNNLLAVILNYAGFVAEAISDNETASADVGKIQIAAKRAADLTRQLVIFSRGEEIQPAFIDLSTVVNAVEMLLSQTISEQIELVVHAAPQLPTVRFDRGQLEQVLVNLAFNARDAMPHGGVLTIETDIIGIDSHSNEPQTALAPGRYVTMMVSDTGTGMSPEVLAHMFEPFFTTKPPGEGTGLGLATVYGIVSEAGGTVRFSSERGAGTTVRVFLPATDEPATSTPPPIQVLVGGEGERVLVVEDADAMREVTSRILRRNGYEALEAANGEEALAMLETHACDLLLTDVIMPHMSGRDLVKKVHERTPGLPVLYMSGYSGGLLDPTRDLGHAVVLIKKPFDEQSLVQTVRSVLDRDASTR
jgi:nitrogen-specific signal transduction histidine kinase